jgi:hypothetical protein
MRVCVCVCVCVCMMCVSERAVSERERARVRTCAGSHITAAPNTPPPRPLTAPTPHMTGSGPPGFGARPQLQHNALHSPLARWSWPAQHSRAGSGGQRVCCDSAPAVGFCPRYPFLKGTAVSIPKQVPQLCNSFHHCNDESTPARCAAARRASAPG